MRSVRPHVLIAIAGLLAAPAVREAAAVDRCLEFQVSDSAIGTGRVPAVTRASDGGFLVVWRGTDDETVASLQARRFDAAGAGIGDQVRVDESGVPHAPAVAANTGGRFLVTWGARDAGIGDDADGTAIQARLLAPTGVPLGAQFQVNAYTTRDQNGPAVGSDGAGGFVVAWSSAGSAGTDTDATSVQARRVDADGGLVGDEFQVNVATTGAQGNPDVVGGAGGGFVIAWSEGVYGPDHQYTSSVRFRRFRSNGAPEGVETIVGETTSFASQYSAAASDGTGGFVLVWTGPDGLEAVRHDATGARIEPAIPIETCATCFQRSVDVAGDGAGGFMVVWEGMGTIDGVTGQGWDVHGRVFAADGAADPEFKVNTETTDFQYFPAIARDGDGFVVAWERNGLAAGPIHARRLDEGGCVTTTTTSTTTSTLPTTLLESRRLVLREGRRQFGGRLVFVARDEAVVVGDEPLGTHGRFRAVSLGSRVVDLWAILPAGGWRAGRRGLRYRGPEGRVRIKPGRRIDVKLDGLELDLPTVDPTPLLVVLEVGGRRFCAVLATAALDLRRRRLVAKGGAAPATCEEPLVPVFPQLPGTLYGAE